MQLGVLLLILVADLSFAAELNVPRAWHDNPDVSIVSTTGNTRTSSISLRNLLTLEENRWKAGVLAGGLGAHSGSQVTAERYFADQKVDWKIDLRNYLFEKVGWSKDRFAGVRARYEGTGGVGRHLWDSPRQKWDGELGFGYIHERRYDSPTDRYPTARGFTNYVYRFNAANSFAQTVEWFFNLTDGPDFRVRTESSITAHLARNLSLKTAFQWQHVNRPPINHVADDTTTAVSLVGSF